MKIRQLEPAGCSGIKKGQHGDLVAQEKIDGHRGLMHVGGTLKRLHLSGRRISKETGLLTEKGLSVPHFGKLHDALVADGIGYTVLDGEVVLPGHPFEDVQKIMGCHSEKAVKRQMTMGEVHYLAFDILFFNGDDVRGQSLRDRRILLMGFLLKYVAPHGGLMNIDQPKTILLDKLTYAQPLELFQRQIVAAGGEGTVVKDLDATYGKGWLKNKVEKTFDVVVMGYKDGVGKFQTMIGAVKFGAYQGGELIEVGKCSGMEDGDVLWQNELEGQVPKPNVKGSFIIRRKGAKQYPGTRAWFTMHRRKLLGTVIEVKCNGLTAKGKLRHPQFLRTRDDKDAQMCVLPQEQS